MTRTIVALSLIIALLIGCTAGLALQHSLVPNALAQAQPPTHQFRTCTALGVPGVQNPREVNEGKPMDHNKMVVVPEGWTPIGGAGGGGPMVNARLIICK